MKSEELPKQFKRKSLSIRITGSQQKTFQESQTVNQSVKYISPKYINGLDNCFYKKEESLIKVLQEEVKNLKEEVKKLREQQQCMLVQNQQLKRIVRQRTECQQNNQNYRFATANVLNQLKEKIQLFSQDDCFSTFDSIDLNEICNCQKYEAQLKEFRGKVKFLQESLLHSQQILFKFRKQNVKLKQNLLKIQRKIKIKISSKQNSENRQKQKVKYKMSSIKQMIQDGQQ